MRATTVFSLTIVVTSLAAPAAAQDALDRVQRGERSPVEDRTVPPSAQPGVEVQVEQPESVPGGREVLVGAVVLAGLEVLQPADFAEVITPRLGQVLDEAGLRELTGAVAAEARSRGFPFATASIEPQRLTSGVLTVHVDEGRIDELRFDGPATPAVRAALAPLVSGAPARLSDVEHRLLIAGDIDGARIRNSRYIREQGRGILLIELSRDPAVVRAALSNEGTKPLGPVQLRIDADVNGLLADDDQLTVSYTGTPANPRELNFGLVRYARRVSSGGTEVALTGSASRARPGAYLRSLGLRSQSWYVGGSVLQPLWRRRTGSLWLEGELGLRNLRQWQQDALVRDDRLAVARATLYGYADVGDGRLRASLTLAQGFDIFDATEPGDPLASRFDADGTFTTLNAWAQWSRSLGSGFSMRLAAQGQLASQPLLISEETSLGGTGFLRGYDWGERSGDEGIMGSAELRYDWNRPFDLVRNAQFYGFLDGGSVRNIDSDFGSGSLASVGGGMRADLSDTLGAAVELAVPLSGPRYDTGDETPKINLRVNKSF